MFGKHKNSDKKDGDNYMTIDKLHHRPKCFTSIICIKHFNSSNEIQCGHKYLDKSKLKLRKKVINVDDFRFLNCKI